jgi:hypothetical protein
MELADLVRRRRRTPVQMFVMEGVAKRTPRGFDSGWRLILDSSALGGGRCLRHLYAHILERDLRTCTDSAISRDFLTRTGGELCSGACDEIPLLWTSGSQAKTAPLQGLLVGRTGLEPVTLGLKVRVEELKRTARD